MGATREQFFLNRKPQRKTKTQENTETKIDTFEVINNLNTIGFELLKPSMIFAIDITKFDGDLLSVFL